MLAYRNTRRIHKEARDVPDYKFWSSAEELNVENQYGTKIKAEAKYCCHKMTF
jgi:hypothetical protein